MKNEEDKKYIKEKLCCDAFYQVEFILQMISAHIATRVHSKRDAKLIIIQLINDANSFNQLKEILGK